jgi:hypothetical protein
MVASAIASVVLLTVYLLAFYSNQSFLALVNHVELERINGNAIDLFSQQVRQASQLTAYSTTNLTFLDFDGKPLRFTYDPTQRTLSRIKQGEATVAYLTDCDFLRFQIFQRTVQPGAFDVFTPASGPDCKVVVVTWASSRNILGKILNSENVQSAKIVIRQK